MFAWANKTLANLAETIAPPASDSTHKFLAACSAQDEHAAVACLTHPMGEDLPPLDPHGVVNPNKGTQPIHVACQYGLIDLVKTLITQYRVSPDAFDSGGNTPLHHASMYSDGSPRHLDLVKILVGEFNASVVVNNSEGKSPYDVATGANVRNYLLPIQLQRETQACLDDGGRGLAPGIDLGGMKINYSNHGAPPVSGGGAPGAPPPPHHPGTPGVGPPPPSSGGLPQAGGAGGGGPPSPYVAPPMGATGAGGTSPMPPSPAVSGDASAAAGAATTPGPPPAPRPTVDPASGGVGPASGAPPTPAQAGPPTPAPPPPAAPPSGGGGTRTYARHSSAPTSGNMKYRPDGFHSSSSDVALQEKYGHAKVDYSHIPPPPMSGGGGGPAPSSGGMPPPPGSGGAAPASGGMPPPPIYGGGGGYSARAGSRYPVYDAVTDTHSLPPPPVSGGGGQPAPSLAPTPPAYSVFQPTAGAGAQVHAQQPPAQQQQPPPHSGGYPAHQQPPHSGGYSAQHPPPQQQQPIYSPPPVGTIPTAGVAVQHSFNQQQQPPPPQPQQQQPMSPASAEEEDSFVS